MQQARIRAVFMRGGTSKAIIFRQSDLPANREQWTPVFLSAIGAPDSTGRQLDGMGGGVSSLSKICVVGPPTHPDADVDYTFAQVGVREATVSYGANCGNMSSAIGPFAVDEGLVKKPAGPEAVVRVHNTNTRKIIVARFAMDGDWAAVDGDFTIDGVAGTGAPIRLDFTNPAGAKTGKLLPTGRAEDVLDIPGKGPVRVSLVDAAAACVFVDAASLGLRGTELPDEIESDKKLLDLLQAIRQHGSVAMKLAPDLTAAAKMLNAPLVALVASPADAKTLAGQHVGASEVDIITRMISMGQAHRASPLTGGLCLAVACHVPGSLPQRLMQARSAGGDICIGHPSGKLLVGAAVKRDGDGLKVEHATVYRTARRLFQGEVLVRGAAMMPSGFRIAAE